MNRIMEERMKEAMDKKTHDINSFVWKSGKVKDSSGSYRQSEQRLVDMSEAELRKCDQHCNAMLFNEDAVNPGRYKLFEILKEQRDKCGAELFLRYLDQEKQISRYTFRGIISDFLNNNRDSFKEVVPAVGDMTSGIPEEFVRIPLSEVMNACLNRLGVFNKKHLTRTFILKQGIWMTNAEIKDLVEYDANGKLIDRLEVIRERLNLKEIEKLFINSKGLNYTQMRAMLRIKPNQKYEELTTDQLKTLRYRMLFNLEEEVNKHIESWERRRDEIEMVATYKGFNIYKS